MNFAAGVLILVGGLVGLSVALDRLLPDRPIPLAWQTARALTVTAVAWTLGCWLVDSYAACAPCLLAALAGGWRTRELSAVTADRAAD